MKIVLYHFLNITAKSESSILREYFMRIIIAGGGPAAVEAAFSIRQYDQDSSIDIYTGENVLPYRRTLLPAVLAKTVPLERLPIYPAEFYRQYNINIHLASKVVYIDKTKRCIVLQSGQSIEFDRLLVATGCRARKLPVPESIADKVFTLHDLEDVEKIEQALPDSSEAIVIGGGVLGLECAAALLKRKLKVTLIEQYSHIMHGVLDMECSNFLQKELLTDSNLKIITSSQLQKITLSGNKISCTLSSGKCVYADILVSAIGLIPGDNLGLELTTDEYLQVTGCKDIYAAGDCAVICNRPNRYYKGAFLQGRIAGENITGLMKKYTFLPDECRSILNNTAFYAAGLCDAEKCEADSEQDHKSLKKLFYLQDRLVGCMLVGNVQDAGELYSIIRKHHRLLS